jgi:hypothetical protein
MTRAGAGLIFTDEKIRDEAPDGAGEAVATISRFARGFIRFTAQPEYRSRRLLTPVQA